MTKRFLAIIAAVVCVGCVTRKSATDTYTASHTERHDTVIQFREVVKVDSVYVYHGRAKEVRNDTVFLTDTIRETRWAFLHLNDTTARLSDTLSSDTLIVEKTNTEYVEKRSGWSVFTTIWFVLSVILTILIIAWKIWRLSRK